MHAAQRGNVQARCQTHSELSTSTESRQRRAPRGRKPTAPTAGAQGSGGSAPGGACSTCKRKQWRTWRRDGVRVVVLVEEDARAGRVAHVKRMGAPETEHAHVFAVHLQISCDEVCNRAGLEFKWLVAAVAELDCVAELDGVVFSVLVDVAAAQVRVLPNCPAPRLLILLIVRVLGRRVLVPGLLGSPAICFAVGRVLRFCLDLLPERVLSRDGLHANCLSSSIW
jgi:hypothetical protein